MGFIVYVFKIPEDNSKEMVDFELALVKEMASSHKSHFYKILALGNVAD